MHRKREETVRHNGLDYELRKNRLYPNEGNTAIRREKRRELIEPDGDDDNGDYRVVSPKKRASTASWGGGVGLEESESTNGLAEKERLTEERMAWAR